MDEDTDPLVDALRGAGCVFAEEEAQILRKYSADDDELGRWTRRRIDGEPLEHVVGVVAFAGHELAVGPGVFIPRQRTRLVAAIASEAVAAAIRAGDAEPVVVEPYCGAAPIAAVVARDHPSVVLVATDIDSTAIGYAEVNLGPSATVRQGSGLAGVPVRWHGRVAVIAAVPPYVPDGELNLMPGEARTHEADRTHAGGATGLDEAVALLSEAPAWLRPGGVLLAELHRDQAPTAIRAAEAAGLRAEMITDHAAYPDDGHTAVVRSTVSDGHR